MSLARYLNRGQEPWQELEELVERLEGKKSKRRRRKRKEEEVGVGKLPALFRRACQDLALAKHRDYSTKVVQRLNRLALRSHHLMYRERSNALLGVGRFLAGDFPRLVRQEWALLFWSTLLFFGPGTLIAVAIQSNPELAWSVLGAAEIEQMEEMYDPSGGFVTIDRESDSDVAMFGLYIWNNIGIAFRTFAGGVFFGLGTIFFLFFNSIVLGAVFGHLTHIGLGVNLYPFVVGHGAFELTGIVIAGVAGLRLGMGLVSPGRKTRGQAFRDSAQRSVQIISGAGCMLLIAAFIEAFWSPRAMVASEIKYLVGGVFWLLVILYLSLAGRGQHGS